MKENHWARLLAYVTGLINQELLLKNEYLAEENRILRAVMAVETLAGKETGLVRAQYGRTFQPACYYPIRKGPRSLRLVGTPVQFAPHCASHCAPLQELSSQRRECL
jgi:hypothetical protein